MTEDYILATLANEKNHYIGKISSGNKQGPRHKRSIFVWTYLLGPHEKNWAEG